MMVEMSSMNNKLIKYFMETDKFDIPKAKLQLFVLVVGIACRIEIRIIRPFKKRTVTLLL